MEIGQWKFGFRIGFNFGELLFETGVDITIARDRFMAFPFEDLEVYKRSIKFCSQVESILQRPGITRSLCDQLSRAALSIPLNVAEGNGRWHKGDKRQFFWIARGSAFECIPIVEVLTIKNILSTDEKLQLRSDLEVISKMLTKLAQVHEK